MPDETIKDLRKKESAYLKLIYQYKEAYEQNTGLNFADDPMLHDGNSSLVKKLTAPVQKQIEELKKRVGYSKENTLNNTKIEQLQHLHTALSNPNFLQDGGDIKDQYEARFNHWQHRITGIHENGKVENNLKLFTLHHNPVFDFVANIIKTSTHKMIGKLKKGVMSEANFVKEKQEKILLWIDTELAKLKDKKAEYIFGDGATPKDIAEKQSIYSWKFTALSDLRGKIADINDIKKADSLKAAKPSDLDIHVTNIIGDWKNSSIAKKGGRRYSNAELIGMGSFFKTDQQKLIQRIEKIKYDNKPSIF